MRTKKSIELEVFIFSDEEMDLVKLGLKDESSTEFSTKDSRSFWVIDVAFRCFEDNRYTTFLSCGQVYISPLSYKDFVRKVDSHMKIYG